MKSLRRFIATVLVLCFLPIEPFAALAESVTAQSTHYAFIESMTSDQDVIIEGESVLQGTLELFSGASVVLKENAEFIMDEGAVLIGSVRIEGENARFENAGTVTGDVITTCEHGEVENFGRIEGMLDMEGLAYVAGKRHDQTAIAVTHHEDAYIHEVLLNGTGVFNCNGDVDIINTTKKNITECLVGNGAHVGEAYMTGSGSYIFRDKGTVVDKLYLTDHRNSPWVYHVWCDGYANEIYMKNAHLCVHNGGQVGTIYMDSRSLLSIGQGHETDAPDAEDDKVSYVERIILEGGDWAHIDNQGYIGSLVAKGGNLYSVGRIDSLNAVNMDITFARDVVNAYEEGPDQYRPQFGKGVLSHHLTAGLLDHCWVSFDESPEEHPEIVAKRKADGVEQEPWHFLADTLVLNNTQLTLTGQVNHLFTMGDSSVTNRTVNGVEEIRLGSKKSEIKEETIEIDCVEMSTLKLNLDASGGDAALIVTAPDGRVQTVYANGASKQAEFSAPDGGVFTVRHVTVTGESSLTYEKQSPIRIRANIARVEAVKKGQKAASAPDVIGHYDAALYNTTRGAWIPLTLQRGALFADADQADVNDELVLTLTAQDGSADSASFAFVLDENREAALDCAIPERGTYTVSYTESEGVSVYLYNDAGHLIERVARTDLAYTTSALSAGNYTAVTVRAGAGQLMLPRLETYSEYGLEAGKDYLADTFSIQAGECIERDRQKPPAAPSVSAEWLVVGKTGYKSAETTAIPGALLLMTLTYEQAEGSGMLPVQAMIDLSAGAALVPGSMSVNGQVVECAREGNTLTVPLNAPKGSVQFYLQATEGYDEVTSFARLLLSDGNRMEMEYIGTGSTQIVDFSIYGQQVTGDGSVLVRGYAAPYETVTIRTGSGAALGTTMSDREGIWSARVILDELIYGATTTIYGVLFEGTPDEIRTQGLDVMAVMNAPTLESLNIHYVEHGVNKVCTIDGNDLNKLTVKLAYEPDTTMTFVAKVTNDEHISDVTIVAMGDGLTYELPLEYQEETDEWVTEGVFSQDEYFTPTRILVTYTMGMQSLFDSSAYESLILPRYRALTDDLMENALSLTRVYPANGERFNRKGLFGVGWMTNYEGAALTWKNGRQEYMLVSYMDEYDLLEKRDGKFVSVAEDGVSARVSRDGSIALTREDGTLLTFAAEGYLIGLASPNGAKAALTYEDGKLVRVSEDGGEVLELTYGENGYVTQAAVKGNTIDYIYDGDCLVGVRKADGLTGYSYLTEGRALSKNALIGIRHPDGTRTQYGYDSYGRTTYTVKDGVTTTLTYGADHSVTMETAGGMRCVYVGDEYGRMTSVTDGAGNTTRYSYTEDSQIAAITFADGTQRSFEYDKNGYLAREIYADGSSIAYTHDKNGNVTSITDAAGRKTTYSYDEKENLTQIRYPDGTSEKYTYRGEKLSTHTDRMGQKASYQYDEWGNVRRTEWSDGSFREYDYDDRNILWAIRSEDTEMFFGYDEEGVLNHVNYNEEEFLNFEFSEDGMPLWYETNSGYRVSYQYDAYGRMTAMLGPDDIVLSSIEYNADGMAVKQTFSGGAYTTVDYANGMPSAYTTYGPDGEVLHSETYVYDSMNRLAASTENGKTTLYGYDSISQLISETAPDGTVTSYAYDAAGSRVRMMIGDAATDYEVGENGQILRAGDTTYTYDKNGRMILEESAAGTTSYAYDAQGYLIAVEGQDLSIQYTYDLLGNLRSETRNGERTDYLFSPMDSNQLLMTSSAQGATYYGWASRLSAIWNEQGVYSVVSDRGGDVSLWLNADGQKTEVDSAFKTMGAFGVMDLGNGMLRTGVRLLDTRTGMYTAPDPLGQSEDTNTYRYCYNQPNNMVDITGCVPVPLILFGIGLAVGLIGTLIGDLINLAITGKWEPDWREYFKNGLIGGLAAMVPGSALVGITAWLAPAIGDALVKSKDPLDFLMNLIPSLIIDPFLKKLPFLEKLMPIKNFHAKFPWLTEMPGIGKKRPKNPDKWMRQRPKNKWGLPEHDKRTELPSYLVPKALDDFYGEILPAIKGEIVDLLGKITKDPSGYVFEAVESNRLEGVTAVCYFMDENGEAVVWNAEEWDQINPQITDALGQYAWYVPEGQWMVTYEKEGYVTTASDWLTVPPPQTEVNQAMVSLEAPALQAARLYRDAIELELSKYVYVDSIGDQAFLVTDAAGQAVAVTLTALNAEQAWDGSGLLATKFSLKGEKNLPEQATLQFSGDAVSYAGVPAQQGGAELTRISRIKSISLKQNSKKNENGEVVVTATLAGEKSCKGMSLDCGISAPDLAQIVSVSSANSEGRVTIVIKPILPGTVVLTATEPVTGTTVAVELSIE